MKAAFFSLLLSALVIDAVLAASSSLRQQQQQSSVQIPSWVRRLIRRSRRRNSDEDTGCNAYANARCRFGDCLLADPAYPDTAENFKNAGFGTKFYCMCNSGFETYYPDNEEDKSSPPDDGQEWCNAEEDPCRVENEEDPNVCQSEGKDNTCMHTGPNQFECQCTSFWTGSICQLDVNECKPCETGDDTSCPCKNGAICQNMVQSDSVPLGFQCYCEPGTSGQFCEQIKDPCLRQPCLPKAKQGGAKAENPCTVLNKDQIDISIPATLSGYTCACEDYWGGQDCEMRQGSCSTNPCEGRGQCTDDPNYPNFYQCICFDGYENEIEALNNGANGKFCTKIKNMCEYNPCRQESICLTLGANQRECVCQPGWAGPLCESLLNPCYSPGKPKCLNGGVCKAKENSGVEYTCTCKEGYEGNLCENNKNECSDSSVCGEGTCVDTKGSFKCDCKAGYKSTPTDKTCKTVQSLCDIEANICQYGGTCLKKKNIAQNFECGCGAVMRPGSPAVPFLMAGDSFICNKGKEKLVLSEVDWESASPNGEAVFLTRSQGILNNKFVKLVRGSFKLKAPTVDVLPGNMILYFHTPTPTEANLMTVWDDSGKKKSFEISPSASGNNFVLKFLNSDPKFDIILPKHSSKGWNNINIRTNKDTKKVMVYLNSALIESRTVTTLPSIPAAAPAAVIHIGTDVDENGAPTGPKFDGGVGDLMFFNKPDPSMDTSNLLKLDNPDCKQYMDLQFDMGNVYSDAGCMKLDPVPVWEEVRSAIVEAPNGFFPMLFFKSHADVAFTKPYLATKEKTQVLVPSFSTLLNPDNVVVDMLFRFRPNFEGLKGDKIKNFAQSKFVGTPPQDVENPMLIQVGTHVHDKKFEFVLTLTTDAEVKTVKAMLAENVEDKSFCKECIWSVAAKLTVVKKDNTGADNLKIMHMVNGKQATSTYSLKGQLLRESALPLEIGVDKAHEVGAIKINTAVTGCGITSDEIGAFLQSKGDKPAAALDIGIVPKK